MYDPTAKLKVRQRIYLKGLAAGKTKKQAALDAGYSVNVARSAGTHIETKDVKEAFARLIRSRIPAHKIAQRIAEGLDAMETKFFQEKGVVTDSRDVVAWGERRQYAQLAAEYGGYAKTDEQGDSLPDRVLVLDGLPVPTNQPASVNKPN